MKLIILRHDLAWTIFEPPLDVLHPPQKEKTWISSLPKIIQSVRPASSCQFKPKLPSGNEICGMEEKLGISIWPIINTYYIYWKIDNIIKKFVKKIKISYFEEWIPDIITFHIYLSPIYNTLYSYWRIHSEAPSCLFKPSSQQLRRTSIGRSRLKIPTAEEYILNIHSEESNLKLQTVSSSRNSHQLIRTYIVRSRFEIPSGVEYIPHIHTEESIL